MLKRLFGRKPDRARQNNIVRDLLRRHADSGESTRPVTHYAYPRPGADLSERPAMIENLTSYGFSVQDALDDGVILGHDTPVDGAAFDALTSELEAWFEAYGWEYDGWETAVSPDA